MHVLEAESGSPKPPFPFRAFGKIMAAPLLTKLDSHKSPGLQIVFVAFDGFLYVVDGATGARRKRAASLLPLMRPCLHSGSTLQ